jgi:hypothetical protein
MLHVILANAKQTGIDINIRNIQFGFSVINIRIAGATPMINGVKIQNNIQ